MSQTLKQQEAALEAKLAKLREKSRQLENGQKIILGGMLINAAKNEPRIRDWLLKEAAKSVTREVDKKRLQPLLDELSALNPPAAAPDAIKQKVNEAFASLPPDEQAAIKQKCLEG